MFTFIKKYLHLRDGTAFLYLAPEAFFPFPSVKWWKVKNQTEIIDFVWGKKKKREDIHTADCGW